MAKIRRRFDKGIELRPEDLSAEDLSREGELAYDSDSDRLKYRNASATQEIVDTDSTQTVENKTIDATAATGNNTISADSDNIVYDPTISGLVSTNVKDALDEIQANVLAENEAVEIEYNPADSSLVSTNVKDALDEVAGRLDTAETNISTNASDLSAHIAETSTHGVSGAIVGTSSSQSLSNKTFTTNNRINNYIEEAYSNEATASGDTTINAPVAPILRLTSGSLTGLQGIVAPSGSAKITLINKTGSEIFLYNEDASALADRRFVTGTGDDLPLDVDASVLLQYSDVDQRWHVVGGVGASGGASTFEIEKASHGFAVGNGIYHNGADWVLGQANNVNTLAYYVVIEVIDANTFVAADFARIEAIGHGYTVGSYYFLSESTPGAATSTEPSTGFSNPLFYVEDANTLQIKVYRPDPVGEQIPLDELSDVQVPSPSDNDILSYNSGSGLWEALSQEVNTTATIANNQAATDVVGFADLVPGTYTGYVISYHITRSTDTQAVAETGTLRLAYNSNSGVWGFADVSGGDDSGVIFSMDGNSLQYESDDLTGTGYSGSVTLRISEKF